MWVERQQDGRDRGVSFMELLAMEMKAAGRYVARGLSFRYVLVGVGGEWGAEQGTVPGIAPVQEATVVGNESSCTLSGTWAELQVRVDCVMPGGEH